MLLEGGRLIGVCGSGEKDIPQGLKPGFVEGLNAWAKAHAYLRINSNGKGGYRDSPTSRFAEFGKSLVRECRRV